MKVAVPDKQILFISGTASVNEHGETIHINDIRRQIERMLINVRELLKPHGAAFANVAQVITYLKWPEHLHLVEEIWAAVGPQGPSQHVCPSGSMPSRLAL